MANRYAVATGNWSNTAIWDGGTLPTVGDDVRANGFTVTINQDITVNSIRNDALAPAVLGGQFIVNSSGRTLLCDLFAASFDCLVVTGFTGNINITGDSHATNSNGSGVSINGVGITLNFVGDAYSGFVNSGGGSTSNSGIRIFAGNFNFVGNAWGRGGGFANGIYSNAVNSVNTFTGNAYNNGNTLHQNGSGLQLIGVNSVNTFNGTGECISNLTNEIRGAAIIVGPSVSLSGNILVIGSELGVGSGINSSSTNVVINQSINRNGLGALLGIKYAAINPQITVLNENNVSITLTDPSQTNPPDEEDVRLGTSYGGGAFIGLLAVPSPSQVSLGVPTDNTVGTGIVTGTDFFNLLATSSDPLAERLRNVATVQTVGDQFNSFSQ